VMYASLAPRGTRQSEHLSVMVMNLCIHEVEFHEDKGQIAKTRVLPHNQRVASHKSKGMLHTG
jgi:hypothetical protein